MTTHTVATHRPGLVMKREDQLAWKLAQVAADPVEVEPDVASMIVNRVIDNAGVAAAALTRSPVTVARSQAVGRPTNPGATVVGLPHWQRFAVEWAAWANAVAVRELDFHDTFLAAEYSHPGDNIAPLVAVAQQVGLDGRSLLAGIATAYEVQICLSKAISLHQHKIDHVAHLGVSAAAGLGTALALPTEVIFQAVGQALHTTTATRQSRKGAISSWKAYAPALAAKAAIEAVDRAMRGEGSPTPIYEGEDGVIAQLLGGPEATYHVSLPGPGQPKRAILDSYTKAHSAEYQAQAWIDLAFRLGRQYPKLTQPGAVATIDIVTSHHTHYVIGSGANDPQKYDPTASRETLDHSLPYIFAVALQDGTWHHVDSYAPKRAARPDTVRLWRSITTTEDPAWTERYHTTDLDRKAFGGAVEVRLADGQVIRDQIAVADAHPLGAAPYTRPDYIAKFESLASGATTNAERTRFITLAERLAILDASEVGELNLAATPAALKAGKTPRGLW